MYKDIIRYKLAEGVTEEHLLAVAQSIIETWMSSQPGFIKWEIHQDSGNGYTDIVYWKSKEDAKRSEADMVNIPMDQVNSWQACYEDGTMSSTNLSLVTAFEKEQTS